MIINPIIPIWLMTIISISLIIVIVYDKSIKEAILDKKNNKILSNIKGQIKTKIFKIAIVICLFIINLRFMIPNGEGVAINSDFKILFVIDKSVSMRALDYNGGEERIKGVINDCCNIVNKLSSCKFSIITFGDTAQRIVPFTTDIDMIQAELKALTVENDRTATGSSLNIVKDVLEKTLKKESEKNNGKLVVFFVSDGEITKENEILESFSGLEKYIYNGAVMGYGTTAGGKMINELYKDNPNSEFYYLYYYENYEKVTGVSKIDEKNLGQIAKDLNIDYIQMSKPSNINYKLADINKQILSSQTSEEKTNSYQDIYYYFAIPLVILLIIDFIIQKRRMI